jgi:hypothetical protein
MSARGARSRKVQTTEVEKKEKKVTGKGKAPEPNHESRDAFAEWRPAPSTNNSRNGISRSLTVSSNHSHTTSRSSSTHDGRGPRLNTVPSDVSSEGRSRPPKSSEAGSASISEGSMKGKDKTKYQAKGKETQAPRGRGGGVPIKRSVVPSPAPPPFRSESSASYALPTQKTWMNFKVWEGGKDVMRPYGGFDFVRSLRFYSSTCANRP